MSQCTAVKHAALWARVCSFDFQPRWHGVENIWRTIFSNYMNFYVILSIPMYPSKHEVFLISWRINSAQSKPLLDRTLNPSTYLVLCVTALYCNCK